MPFDLPPPVPAFEITLSSHGMSKGISQSDHAQIIPRLSVKSGAFQAGALWKNVTSPAARGEAQLFVGWSGSAGGFALTAGAVSRHLTGIKNHSADNHSWDFTGSVGRKVGRLGLRLSAIYSPDDLGPTRRSLYVEAGPSFTLPKGFQLSAAAARRSRAGAPDYTAFNAAVIKTLGKNATLDLRYYDTDRHRLGPVYKGRLVGSVKFTF